MAEKKVSEDKKYQVYKVATELNIGRTHILEFLQKKGVDVSKPMYLKIGEEMYQEVIKAFKKDKENVEKHKEKVDTFKKKHQATVEADKKKIQTQEEKPEDKPEIDFSFKVTDIPKTDTVEKTEIPDTAEKPVDAEEVKEVIPVEAAVETVADAEIVEVQPEAKIAEEVVQPDLFATPEIQKEQKPEHTTEDIPEVKAEDVPEVVIETITAEPVDINSKKEEVETVPEEKPSAGSEQPQEAVTTLTGLKGERKTLVIKGKIDLSTPKKTAKSDPQKHSDHTTKGSRPKDKPAEKTKDNLTAQSQGAKEVPKDDKKAGTKPDKKPKKKKLREEIKKKQGDEEAKAKKVKKGKVKSVDERDVDDAIKRTLEQMSDLGSTKATFKKKKKKEKQEIIKHQIEEDEKMKSVLKVTEYMTVNDLSKLMNVGVGEVISKFLSLGLLVSINQRLDIEKIQIVADEFGFTIEPEEEFKADELTDVEDKAEDLRPRPPVVTIMGHVDHGKTSLLDRIRNSLIVAGESGGITQHIGAYKVQLSNGKEIIFLDTPGHEAFTAMRARGAQVTDIVILVVAADDGVMPQTTEAINHAQAAGVPIIVAVNKIDKPGINLDRLYKELAEKNILVEKWGGKFQSAEISAKKDINIDVLLEKVLLEAEILDLKANPARTARGNLVEVKLDKWKGITATVLVRKGTLKVGDPFVAGVTSGRVRSMFDERDKKVDSAPPATPVLITGFNEMPQAGDEFVVVESDKIAHEISVQRTQIKKAQDRNLVRHVTLDDISQQIRIGGVKDLCLIVKGDVDGSVEALSDSLMKLSTSEVRVQVIHKGVGAIVESDVLLAATSNAIIIGFHVRPNLNARKLSESENIEIRLYNIIYDVINEVKSAIEGMLAPEISEEVTSTIQVREVFKISRVGTIAGCMVQSGKVVKSHKARIYRNDIVLYEGRLETLKRFKDDVREVETGYECGIKIENFNDLKVDDIIETFKIVEKKRKLENVGKN